MKKIFLIMVIMVLMSAVGFTQEWPTYGNDNILYQYKNKVEHNSVIDTLKN